MRPHTRVQREAHVSFATLIFTLAFVVLPASGQAGIMAGGPVATAAAADDGAGEEVAEPTPPGSSKTVMLPGNVELELVWIPPGIFKMGSPPGEEGRNDDEGPQHDVQISEGFWLGKYEVTQAQWQTVASTTPWRFRNDRNPVETVSRDACDDFIQKLNVRVPGVAFRLPSETEWEYACRAGSTTAYCFGENPWSLKDYAWYSDNADVKTHPVGSKKPNVWGLYDMYGNVSEWCSDYRGDYSSGPTAGPAESSEGLGRWRGGNWDCRQADCRSAKRNAGNKSSRDSDLGFRLLASDSLEEMNDGSQSWRNDLSLLVPAIQEVFSEADIPSRFQLLNSMRTRTIVKINESPAFVILEPIHGNHFHEKTAERFSGMVSWTGTVKSVERKKDSYMVNVRLPQPRGLPRNLMIPDFVEVQIPRGRLSEMPEAQETYTFRGELGKEKEDDMYGGVVVFYGVNKQAGKLLLGIRVVGGSCGPVTVPTTARPASETAASSELQSRPVRTNTPTNRPTSTAVPPQDASQDGTQLPTYSTRLQGRSQVRIKNPNSFSVLAAIRSGDGGVDIDVPAKGVRSARIPNGSYDIYFVYSNEPDRLSKGDSFTLDNNGVELKIEAIDGNRRSR